MPLFNLVERLHALLSDPQIAPNIMHKILTIHELLEASGMTQDRARIFSNRINLILNGHFGDVKIQNLIDRIGLTDNEQLLVDNVFGY